MVDAGVYFIYKIPLPSKEYISPSSRDPFTTMNVYQVVRYCNIVNVCKMVKTTKSVYLYSIDIHNCIKKQKYICTIIKVVDL